MTSGEPYPPLGRMVAWLPSSNPAMPIPTHTGHRKFRVHLHGFHCKDSASLQSRLDTLTIPSEGEWQAEIYAFREASKRWTKATKSEMKVFADLEDADDVLMATVGSSKQDVFSKPGNWGRQGHCQHGDCLYAIVMAYMPVDAFKKDAKCTRTS